MKGERNVELLRVLMDKWKHHDTLCYQRLNTFWTVQSVITAIVVFIFRAGIIPINLFLIALFIMIAAGTGFVMKSMAEADIRVRNAYNDAIVRLLNPFTSLSKILSSSENAWSEAVDSWRADDLKNPINFWHTSNPSELGKQGKGSDSAIKVMKVIACLELATAAGFVVWGAIIWWN